MRERNRTGRGGRRRSVGDGEEDLFATQLSKVVENAFGVTDPDAKSGEAALGPPISGLAILKVADGEEGVGEAIAPPEDGVAPADAPVDL